MQNKRILIVDDDQFIREILVEILQSEGFVVQTAENGVEGYDKFCTDQNFDLVITDLVMPEMGGLELIDKLRSNDVNVPVIVLSGNDDISNALTALKKGADEYLVKDSNIADTILISVTKVLEKRRLEETNFKLMHDIVAKNEKLLKQLNEINALRGLLPICAACKKIRDDTGYWEEIDTYLSAHSEVEFTHSLCEPCIKKLYPKHADSILAKI
ncbi:MAG: response regulator, partial [Candidatus Anammoxibacter sp.]